MLISKVVEKVVTEKQAVLVRQRDAEKGDPIEYDVKDLFQGNKRGWVILDLFTCSAMWAVYGALSPENKPLFDKIPLVKLVDFTWKNVS